MKNKDKKANVSGKIKETRQENDTAGYPIHPPEEDVYNQWKEEKSINPEDVSKKKTSFKVEKKETRNEKDFKDDVSGGDLDVPGSELDDEDEKVGSEDEENNYYSLGGDDHENLDEDKG